jgi:hypothetical protein
MLRREYRRLADTEAKRAKIKDLVAQGKSLDEIKAAVGDPPPNQGRGGGRGAAGRSQKKPAGGRNPTENRFK